MIMGLDGCHGESEKLAIALSPSQRSSILTPSPSERCWTAKVYKGKAIFITEVRGLRACLKPGALPKVASGIAVGQCIEDDLL